MVFSKIVLGVMGHQGSKRSSQKRYIEFTDQDSLNEKILAINSEKLTSSILEYHETQYPLRHLFKNEEKYPKSLILEHCEAIWDLDFGDKQKFLSTKDYNLINLGYIFMLNDKFDFAEKCFKTVLTDKEYTPSNVVLNHFNSAILKIKQKKHSTIVKDMKGVISLAEEYLKTDNAKMSAICTCLLVPSKDEKGNVIFTEHDAPNIINISKGIISTFET